VSNAWWRTHRPVATTKFRDEIRAVRNMLAETPEAGRLDMSGRTNLRIFPIVDIRYLVYYRVDHQKRIVEIVAIWHASRQRPDLH
jgi:plasmid stabilization system protein ParE